MHDKEIQKIDTRVRILEGETSNNDLKFKKMRVKVDWRLADDFVRKLNSQEVTDKLRYMKKIMKTVENYFEQRIDVNSRNSMNIGLTSCFGKPWPQDIKQNVEEDLVILINPFNERSGWFAAAGACAIDGQTGRPVAGAVFLNFLHIRLSQINEFYLPPIFIHELLHVMGFSAGFFRRQNIVQQKRFGNKTMWGITSPGVVNHARKFFNCANVEAVPLEDGGSSGSAGSHWEKTLFPSEVMNPQVASPMIISEFTIKLLEDLGWYRGDNAHQNYTFLKNDGCGNITNMECNAEKSEEFCTSADFNQDHCHPNKMMKAHCGRSSTFTKNCGYMNATHSAMCHVKLENGNRKSFSFESYGPHSRCIMTKKSTNNYDAACLRVRCKNDAVEIKIGDEVFKCPGEGTHNVNLNSYQGSIKCPSFNDMCTEVMDKKCPMDCYGQGYCMANNTCQCLDGFTGADCNAGRAKDNDPFVNDENDKKEEDEEKEKEEEKEDEEEKEKEDEEKEKEDEEEKDDEEEDEDEKDDEEDEDKENEDEENEEEEEEKSEEAIKYEEKIRKHQTFLDFHKFHRKRSQYRINKADLCLEIFEGKSFCKRSKEFNERNLARYEEKIQKIENRIGLFEQELEKLLTERQKNTRKENEEENNINRQINIDEKYMELLESEQAKALKRKDRIESIIINLNSKLQRVRSEKFKARIRQIIEKFEKQKELKDRLLEMIETEMEDLFGVGRVKNLEKIDKKYVD